MDNTIRTRNVAVLAAALAAAIAVSLGVGSALAAPPLKNAERTCTKVAGTFSSGTSQYTCAGTDSTKTYSFLETFQRQCQNSFKGTFGYQIVDYATGQWRYTCFLP